LRDADRRAAVHGRHGSEPDPPARRGGAATGECAAAGVAGGRGGRGGAGAVPRTRGPPRQPPRPRGGAGRERGGEAPPPAGRAAGATAAGGAAAVPAGAITWPLPARDRRRRLAVGATVTVMVAIAAVFGVRLWMARAVPEVRSLAVLPLENLSGNEGQIYFADG